MGLPRVPPPACLILGILLRNPEDYPQFRDCLTECFGPLSRELPPFPFRWTSYYADELGAAPWRAFLAFETLIPRDALAEIKNRTNALEQEWSDHRGRRVNLDPGLLTLGQLFLASTKDQRQRVYLRDGIYAEPTLYFQDGQYHPFPWTYRDYQSAEYLEFFLQVRRQMERRLKQPALTSHPEPASDSAIGPASATS